MVCQSTLGPVPIFLAPSSIILYIMGTSGRRRHSRALYARPIQVNQLVLVPARKPHLAIPHVKHSHHVGQERDAQHVRPVVAICHPHAAHGMPLVLARRGLAEQVVGAHVEDFVADLEAERRDRRIARGIEEARGRE